MEYYECSFEAVHKELQRRAHTAHGSHDQLSELLWSDDDERGSEATTVMTKIMTVAAPYEPNSVWEEQFGSTFPAEQLVNQSVNYFQTTEYRP